MKIIAMIKIKISIYRRSMLILGSKKFVLNFTTIVAAVCFVMLRFALFRKHNTNGFQLSAAIKCFKRYSE